MDQLVKAKWLAALRSGEYSQTSGALKDSSGFCCLGVLCDIHAKETGESWVQDRYIDESSSLPEVVGVWAGLNKADGDGPNNVELPNGQFLSEINDCGTSFNSIANIIEEQL